LYDYLQAHWHYCAERTNQMAASFEAAKGKKLELYGVRRRDCLTIAMDKVGLPKHLQQYIIENNEKREPIGQVWLSYFLMEQAAEAQDRGDVGGAKVLRNAAAQLDATTQGN
jgi:hypothetical protein